MPDSGNSQIFDVKALGVKGDGTTDDTTILNRILDVAANVSGLAVAQYERYSTSNGCWVRHPPFPPFDQENRWENSAFSDDRQLPCRAAAFPAPAISS